MATNVYIAFYGNPVGFELMYFNIQNLATGYYKIITKSFVLGTPTNSNQVKIGASLPLTITALLENLNANDADSVISYSEYLDDDGIGRGFLCSFNPPGDYFRVIYSMPAGSQSGMLPYVPEVPVATTLEPLDHHNFGIVIIDTYENDRILIDELTQLGSPRIVWDGGDDIYAPIETSQLNFNMKPVNNSDGQFYHLFTNDEKRYKVQLLSVDASENTTLIWQGFLLPDLYNEPYKGGVVFVDFTAVDMIGLLKGVKLPQWYYNNRLPIMFLLSEIMKRTGLEQQFIIAPSLVPGQSLKAWKDINVPMFHYYDGKDYTDCYSILNDILTANLLTLTSFRGYWILKGVSRKHEAVNEGCYFFEADGTDAGRIDIQNRLRRPKQLDGSVVLSALTPFKTVNVLLDAKKADNVFSKEVVALQKGSFKNILYSSFVLFNNPPEYLIGFFDNWEKVGNWNADIEEEDRLSVNLFYGDGSYGLFTADSDAAMAWSLSKYYRCKEHPYVLPNVQYNLTIEGRVSFNLYYDGAEFWSLMANAQELNLSEGYAPIRAFIYEVLVSGQVVASNRPDYPFKDRFDVAETNDDVEPASGSNPAVGSFKYVVTGKFSAALGGNIEVRLYAPSYYNNNISYWRMRRISLSKLVLSLEKEVDLTKENVTAVREIDYTRAFDYNIGFTNTKNGFVKNCFGLNAASNSNFFYPLTWVLFGLDQIMKQRVWYSDTLTEDYGIMYIRRFVTDQWTKLFGFKRLYQNIFLEKADGSARPFNMVACRKPNLLAFLLGTELFPELPENYEPMVPPDLDVESPKYMEVTYPNEDIPNYDNWRIHGQDELDSFKKSIAKAIHYTRPETMFSLESTFFGIVFPNELPQMRYMDELRTFIPSRREIDLSAATTRIKSTEAKYEPVTDISYE